MLIRACRVSFAIVGFCLQRAPAGECPARGVAQGVLSVAGAVADVRPVCCSPNMAETAVTSDEQEVLRLVNVQREALGLPPLRFNVKLCRAAREHSQDMARQNVLSHTLDGRSFGDRLRAIGCRCGEAGENCAQGAPTPAGTVDMWLHSPGHRGNMLSPRYGETGIAVSANGEEYFTQIFVVAAPE